jgi:hypothetical protein
LYVAYRDFLFFYIYFQSHNNHNNCEKSYDFLVRIRCTLTECRFLFNPNQKNSC